MLIYLAAPVFSQSERIYNRQLAKLLEAKLPNSKIILPQDFRVGDAASYNDRRGLTSLFRQCREAMESADLVLAIVDGADTDSGVAYEIGYARAKGKPVVGLRTDYRQLVSKGLNMMLAVGCNEIVCRFSFNERLDDTANALIEKIERNLPPYKTVSVGRNAV
jgi:nucleoside 2-deoxyribosyltransferase